MADAGARRWPAAAVALNRFVQTVQTLALPTLSFDQFLSYTPSWQETGTFLAWWRTACLVYSFSFRYFQVFPEERELKMRCGRGRKKSPSSQGGFIMFPWNYGFHLEHRHLIFMGAFYTVLVVVATTLLMPLWRSHRALGKRQVESIRWHSDFHDLPSADRVCRHVLTGEFQRRECPNAFDCRAVRDARQAGRASHRRRARRSRSRTSSACPSRSTACITAATPGLRPEADGTVTVGLDDSGKRLIGSAGRGRPAAPGTRIASQRHGVPRTQARSRCPRPFAGGWRSGRDRRRRSRVGILTRQARAAARSICVICCAAREVKPWLMRELERLQLALTMEGASTPSLADGGVPVADIAASYPKADWDAVCGEMFLEP